jgi:Ni,Fe-hydrogenase III small subunit
VNWFLRGLLAGIRTETEPGGKDTPPSISPGLPRTTLHALPQAAIDLAAVCPTGAVVAEDALARVVQDRCVHCMRCKPSVPGAPGAQEWRHDVRFAHGPEHRETEPLDRRFARSLHVRIVDAGDCGSCLNELAQLNGPSYNLHRFGIFITPTPRQADVLLVVGPVTRQMLDPLKAAYDAMPDPKRVVAVGACAASGGIFGPSLMCAGGVADAIPVDLVVPGCPPPPFAIVHALRAVCGAQPLDRSDNSR